MNPTWAPWRPTRCCQRRAAGTIQQPLAEQAHRTTGRHAHLAIAAGAARDVQVCPGQLAVHPFADEVRTRARARRPEHATISHSHDAAGGDAGLVLVQAHGCDRRLRALPRVLADEGTTLVVHRPERRAVVHRTTAEDRAGDYLRIVRPGRTAALVRCAAEAGNVLAGLPGFTTPTMRSPRDDGVVVTHGGEVVQPAVAASLATALGEGAR